MLKHHPSSLHTLTLKHIRLSLYHASPLCGFCNFSLFNKWRSKVKMELIMKTDPLKLTQEEHIPQLRYFQEVTGEVKRNMGTPSRTT